MSTLSKPNPFAGLLKAAAALPKETGATTRFERRLTAAGSGQVILADVSASMAGPVHGDALKINVLRAALLTAPPARLIAFSGKPHEVDGPSLLPMPAGSTALHLALEHAALLRPARTLVISDGEPDSEELALAAAEHVPGVIDVLYCGPADNLRARSFLSRLARAGGGRYATHDIGQVPEQLGPAVRGLLGSGR